MIDMNPTIYALSSAFGRAGVSVIRVSGPAAFDSLTALTPAQKTPPLREARVRLLSDPTTQNPIDAALVLAFKGPHSFTGEDCVEYHVHGGVSIVNGLLTALSRMPNHRMATPGEFTRRGFEHGKFDLTEAEAIADLIDAETEAQRLQALNQLSGSLEELYRGWTERLSRVLALMEADLDFSDQDLPDDILLRVTPDLSDITGAISAHLNDNRRGERLRNGFTCVLYGAPNVGKSSILNRLTQRNAAIVSPLAGTTRDIIETHLDIGGYPVILADMAGVREVYSGPDITDKSIEKIGIERAREAAKTADIILHIFDGAVLPDIDAETFAAIDDRSILVISKRDLMSASVPLVLSAAIHISSLNGDGYNELLAAITAKLASIVGGIGSGAPSLTRQRHREALNNALEALNRVKASALPELAAEDVRLALRALGSITGRVDVEDLLDMIFRDFCIGK